MDGLMDVKVGSQVNGWMVGWMNGQLGNKMD